MATHRERVLWCADPQNHEVEFGEGASQEAHQAAFAVAQQCGFVKLQNAVDPAAIAAIGAAARELLTTEPESPLVAMTLRPSDPLDGTPPAPPASLFSFSDTPTMPWAGGVGRAMLDLPYREPFNRDDVVAAPSLMRLVRAWLGDAHLDGTLEAASLGVAVEQAAYISVGSGTGRQQPHTDSAHFDSIPKVEATAAGAALLPDLPDLAPLPNDSAVTDAFAALRPKLTSGEATYSLNVQLALVDVNGANGPTSLCPATHTELFCQQQLPTVCVSTDAPARAQRQSASGVGGASAAAHSSDALESVDEAIARYASSSGLCDEGLGGTRVHATAKVGDALLYDSRLIHFGGENRALVDRDVLSFTYAHEWYTETARDLTPAAVEQAVAWRRAGRAARAAEGRSANALGAMSLTQLKFTHDTMRKRRDMADTRDKMRFCMMVFFALYIIYRRAQAMMKIRNGGQVPRAAPATVQPHGKAGKSKKA